MSKVYKVTMFIDDINGQGGDLCNVLNQIEETLDLRCILKEYEERDTTEYIERVGDDYAWNTTSSQQAINELESYFKFCD